MKLTSLLSAFVLSTSLISSAVFADEAKKEAPPAPAPIFQEAGYNFVAGSLGVAKPVGSNLSMPLRFNFEVEFSHAFCKELAAGAFVSRNNGKINQSTDVDFGITRLGVEGTYSPISDALISLRAGISFLDVSTSVGGVTIKGDIDSKPIFFGPGFGWIFPVTEKIQVIPNLQYSHFLATGGVESFNVFDTMITVRYTL